MIIAYAFAFLAGQLMHVPRVLTPTTALDTSIAPGQVHEYAAQLPAGGSALVVFRQMGVDLVAEIYDAAGILRGTLDSPNGRQGDERVEIFARVSGRYVIRIRPYGPEEPSGRYGVAVLAFRDARATAHLLASRARARDSAATWLRVRSAIGSAAVEAKFDSIARHAQVIGLGEATHGSRQFGDARVRLTKRAVEYAGYRVLAIEASATRLTRLNEYIAGRAPESAVALVESGWIGRRALREIVHWLHDWNAQHRSDTVALVGVDAQDFLMALPELRAFLAQAYGDRIAARWTTIERELAAADSQSSVFGNSRVDSVVRRQLFDVATTVHSDAAILRHLAGDSAYARASATLSSLVQFADFNGRGSGVINHGRDWYMAANVLAAVQRYGGAKALYWAHNAHVGHPPNATPRTGPAGAVLRSVLGCGYQVIAQTFGSGAFVAQRPNDLEDRLAVDSLPANIDESIDHVMSAFVAEASLSSWGCQGAENAPAWLRASQQMHWVGALWMPGSNPSEASRPTELVRDYDALLFFSRVTADDVFTDRPPIRARP